PADGHRQRRMADDDFYDPRPEAVLRGNILRARRSQRPARSADAAAASTSNLDDTTRPTSADCREVDPIAVSTGARRGWRHESRSAGPGSNLSTHQDEL